MTKVDTFRLRQLIPREEFDYLSLCSALSEYHAPRQKINQLLRARVITRVKKGLYVFGPEVHQAPLCPEVLANLMYGPSCLSLEYALSHHGLIPERVLEFTSVTPKRDKTFDTPLGRFSYRYLPMSKYPCGVEQIWIDSQHPVLMASPEKALCDYLTLRKVDWLTNTAAAQAFLEFDLRIDPGLWKRFNTTTLGKLNEVYRNERIQCLLAAL